MPEQFTAKLPNAMTKAELMEGGMTEEQAELEMHKRVFGADVSFDDNGKPIERGAGSKSHESKLNAKGVVDTPHKKALALEAQRNALTGRGQSEELAKSISAGIVEGMKAIKAQEEAL